MYTAGDKTTNNQIEKAKCFKAKVTTYIAGRLKNAFFEDCLKRGDKEANITRQILDLHYGIIAEFPELKEKEFSAIKQWIIERIKI